MFKITQRQKCQAYNVTPSKNANAVDILRFLSNSLCAFKKIIKTFLLSKQLHEEICFSFS